MSGTRRVSFIMYHDWKPMFEKLTDEEAGKLIKAVFNFAVTGEEPEDEKLSERSSMVFLMMRNVLLQDALKYKERCRKNRDNQLKRWNKEHAGEPYPGDLISEEEWDENYKKRMNIKEEYNGIQSYSKDTDNDKDKEKENDKGKDKDNDNDKEKEKDLQREGKGKDNSSFSEFDVPPELLEHRDIMQALIDWKNKVKAESDDKKRAVKRVMEMLNDKKTEYVITSVIRDAADRERKRF